MVNLLFISNHHRMVAFKNALQPLLKVKVDVVGDFDFGLKEVFEKRPTLVFIQDQIDGVTGESVARHIQMLLGSGSPAFVFMHDGTSKTSSVKGLYEHLIDLSQSDSEVLSQITSILKSLLGPDWTKILVPPRIKAAKAKADLAFPEEHREVADQFVEDFISDLGNDKPSNNTSICPATQTTPPESTLEEPFNVVSSHHDQLADIISESAKGYEKIEPAAIVPRAEKSGGLYSPPDSSVHPAQKESSVPLTTNKLPVDTVAPARSATSPGDSRAAVQAPSTVPDSPASMLPGAPLKSRLAPISPAEFRIKKEHDTEEVVKNDPLRPVQNVFLETPIQKNRYQAVSVFLVACLLAAAGYWMYQKQQLVQQGAKQSVSTVETTPPVAQPVTENPGPRTSDPVVPLADKIPLPTFIPRAGYDQSYAEQNSGWQRYAGPDSEFRVFSAGGKLKAVQVLANPGKKINDSLLKTVLSELAGTGEYKVTSTEHKFGYQVSHATAGRNTELLIYRKKSATHAFVVSLAE